MASAEVNGACLEYVEHGAGEPVVLVHGSASDHRTWHQQYEPFGERFRVIGYSRRYHWPNARIASGAEYCMAEQVDDLQSILGKLNAAPAHLVGHSYGALMCLLLAARAPDLVRSLVLTEPPVMSLFVGMPPNPLELLRLIARRPRLAAGIIKLGALGLGPAAMAANRGDMQRATQLTGTAILGRAAFGNLSEARLGQLRDNLTKEELVSRGFLPPVSRSLVRGNCTPALLVGGDCSPRVFARLLDSLQELLPHSERITIDSASHIVHEDNAAEYNEAVCSFLSSHADRRGHEVRPG